MEEYGKNEGFDMNEDREEVYSKAVKAGKRTYFFDVKATRNNDYYLTITESKRNSIKVVVPAMRNLKFSFTKKVSKRLAKDLKVLLLVENLVLEGN